MKKRKIIPLLLTATLVLTSCGKAAPAAPMEQPASSAEIVSEAETTGLERYKGMSAKEIVSSLTLEQKAAQMVEGALYNVSYDDMKENDYGSILSKYDEIPAPDEMNGWTGSASTKAAPFPLRQPFPTSTVRTAYTA